MSIIIRCADLDQDRGLIIDALLRYLTPLSTLARFQWLYKSNPHGVAHAWIATDDKKQSVVGVAAAFPKRVYRATRETLAWVLGDFCIDGQYRTLGPALQLQRACLATLKAENVEFCYDFPSSTMLAVYKRLGISTTQRMVRVAKPLRMDRKLRTLVKPAVAARILSPIGNWLLSLRNYDPKNNNNVHIESHRGECGEEFTLLARRARRPQCIAVIHSADYLNWRYQQNPLYYYEMFTVRRDGELLGYAIFLHEGEDAMLADLFGIDEGPVLEALLAHAGKLMKVRGVQTLSAAINESDPWLRILQNQGFETREFIPMMIYEPYAAVPSGRKIEQQKWCLMHGDRDS
jgi:hypothetical protein